ncbi:MAG TPA: hypothetical protein DEG69_09310 [Flavobacteriaceae bacterium]|nr:hypothetical protein [Flavobacteriaceae bacterium]
MKPIEDADKNIRAFVDLKAQGPAKGGMFVRNDLKEIVEKIEKDGDVFVVGVVYDGTRNLEILTQTKEEKEHAFNKALNLSQDD